MQNQSYEIRVCTSCGLRYPLSAGHSFGTRCPICMGSTRLVLSRELVTEPGPARPIGMLSKTPRMSLLKTQNAPGAPVEGEPGVFAVLLDNIRSAMNVGAIFRSADGFGFHHVYLCGISPTPEIEAVTKTALGAEDTVPWSYHKDAVKLIRGLKKEGWLILALEDDVRAVSIKDERSIRKDVDRGLNMVLIVGNEVTGVDPELMDLCDRILYIPMYGEKKSFNVAVAFGIAAYALTE